MLVLGDIASGGLYGYGGLDCGGCFVSVALKTLVDRIVDTKKLRLEQIASRLNPIPETIIVGGVRYDVRK